MQIPLSQELMLNNRTAREPLKMAVAIHSTRPAVQESPKETDGNIQPSECSVTTAIVRTDSDADDRGRRRWGGVEVRMLERRGKGPGGLGRASGRLRG